MQWTINTPGLPFVLLSATYSPTKYRVPATKLPIYIASSSPHIISLDTEYIISFKMPAQETQQPQSQQMELPSTQPQNGAINKEQPRPTEQMTPESMSLRGGGGGGICCGLCAGLACFECLDCCC
ncbi:hypothetical protein BJ875DRAFT_78457 [Amylocarpus encephaloides]|uniref:Cysteine-rich transmembrane CYSTM domain-containing protein n=1 Tax=Amylocarpus encephaloides TaxID=45428 RepID=A0A9P7YEV9_9HELO|nr:hypothetical protein BJ875DRAFT_78457 [Amylocarpus encephaloides]